MSARRRRRRQRRLGIMRPPMITQEQYDNVGLQYSRKGDIIQFRHDPTTDWVVTTSGDIVITIARWIRKPRLWGLLPGKVVHTCATNFIRTFKTTDRKVSKKEAVAMKYGVDRVEINDFSHTGRAYARRNSKGGRNR